jgi:putative effector of murein hydrolase
MKSIDQVSAIPLGEIWVYLAGSPLSALVLTLGAYQIGSWIYDRTDRHPFANPVAIAVLLIALVILAIDMPYAQYFAGAQFVHFLLGTATVALAVPIYRGYTLLRQHWWALAIALVAGSLTSIATAVGIARLIALDAQMLQPLFAKSVTAPIAMGVAAQIGASPTLTAVYALLTGIIGAAVGRLTLNFVGSKPWWQRGFALGLAAHGIGTSRAFSVHPEAGTYASLAMGLHGIVGAAIIPVLAGWGGV